MRYEPDRAGVAALLKAPEMGDAMKAIAEAGRAYAVSISPVESGEYKALFDVDVEVQDGRQTAVLANTSDHAVQVEWGARGSNGHHVLGRTIDLIEAG